MPCPASTPTSWPGPVVYYPSSPLRAIQAQAPNATVTFNDGSDPEAAARLAAESDVALVFVNQWTTESIDTSLTLPDNQDALVEAVARANPRTVAVLQTGGPVLMPWAERVAGILEVWYTGHGRRRGDRQPAVRTGQSVGPPPDHLPARREPAAAAAARRHRLHPDPAVHGQLFRRGKGRLPLVRRQPARAALPVRPRPVLHGFRL